MEDQFPNALSDLLLRITNRAWKSDNLFAADSIDAPPNTTYDRIYSIAQCWRDMSQGGCAWCLASASLQLFQSWTYQCRGGGRWEWSSAPLSTKEPPLNGGAILRIAPALRGGSLVAKGAELCSCLPRPSAHMVNTNVLVHYKLRIRVS